MRERIAHFRIDRRLGEGGMGIVFAAHDERLDRPVAIKTIRDAGQPAARERFWREARAAARLNHPNVCQIHDVGEADGELYIAMELLEGESLAERLARGPLPLEEVGALALGILSALEALHRHQIVHRDLKPSNVHLTPHGVKLLDFGLARPFEEEAAHGGGTVTRSGFVVGTPRYMAPEQWNGDPLDARTDLFALGALLYELLTESPAFAGVTPGEVRHATLFEQPPALAGPPAVAAVDRVLRTAMAKKPEDRYPDAGAMTRALREALLGAADADVSRIRPVTRIAVLPFQMLRPDEEFDFLRLSLPDAISASLSGFETLVVRSPWAVSRFDSQAPDFRAIAEAVDVDLVLVGSILRGGETLRVTAQLVGTPAGTTLWSKAHQGAVGDVFALQDSLARQIVESLSIPLAGREQGPLQRDVPASAKSYELFLRANQVGRKYSEWGAARDLYLECLRSDPRYAPAWAELGRIYRLMAKYGTADAPENEMRAADALHRALELNPAQTLAQNYQAAFEVEMGRSVQVLERLLHRLRVQRSDPELLAALVHVCRYTGLLHASLAADAEARRLDPHVRTSAAYSHWMLGEHDRAIKGSDDFEVFLKGYALAAVGDVEQAIAIYRERERELDGDTARAIFRALRAALEGNKEESLAAIRVVLASSFHDPEGLYFMARAAAYIGEPEVAIEILRRVVGLGFYCDRTMAQDPWLDVIRGDARFLELYREAEAGRRRAAQVFFEAEGDKLLGVSAP
ncbi:MAG TPA: protein kinase [Candidatus Eisenbacteria bacterium]|nr:protein kinase [Candidatus Eisenbacteria bacterium]